MIWVFVSAPLWIAAVGALLAGLFVWSAYIFGKRSGDLISTRAPEGLALLFGLALMVSGSGLAYLAAKIAMEWH